MSNHKALLNSRKGSIRQLHEEIDRSEDLSKVKKLCFKIIHIVEQITGRAEVAEDRISELETWSPQTIDFECPNCNHEVQFSAPGSNWYKKQMEILSHGQEQTKSSSGH